MPPVADKIVWEFSFTDVLDDLREPSMHEWFPTRETDIDAVPARLGLIDDAKHKLRRQLFDTHDIVANAVWTPEITMARQGKAQDHV